MPDINEPIITTEEVVNPLSVITQSIVEARRAQSHTFETKHKHLTDIRNVLLRITELSKSDIWERVISEKEDRNFLWSQIFPFSESLLELIDKSLTEGSFGSAYARATRSYVNIGAIGIKREGKSSFISQATSLNPWLIPSRDGDDPCTTASINVINGYIINDDKSKVTDTARVHFYSVPEIVEYLNLYLDELKGSDKYKFGADITTRKQFENKCKELFTLIKPDGSVGDGDIQNRRTFLKYLEFASQYAEFLLEYVYDDNGKIKRDKYGNPVTTTLSYKDYAITEVVKGGAEGKEYYSSVSYYDSPNGETEVYRSFATKFAEVAQIFNIGDSPVTNIQFLDTPGIGESKAGIEKTLSDAITMKLDAVIIVKAVGNSKSDQDNNQFYQILRKRLNSKGSAGKWLYYVLNIWKSKITQGGILKARTKIIEDLTEAQNSAASISLDPSHFRYMNLKDGCEIHEDGTVGEFNNPVNSYLEYILNALVPEILSIDTDFFKDGYKEYNELIAKWNNLRPLIEQLSYNLPVSDTSMKVEKIIEDLGAKLTSLATWNKILESNIKPNLSSFQQAKAGFYVLQVLRIHDSSTDLSNPSYEILKSLCSKYVAILNQYSFRENHYNQNKSFTDYTSRKIALQNLLIDEVKKLIVEEDAKAALDRFKLSLSEAFNTIGKFSFIPASPDSWWFDVADYLKKEQLCPSLERRFRDVAKRYINVREQLSGTITATIQQSLRNDDFGGGEGFSFDTYENALCSFIRSLLIIEGFAKNLIELEVFDKELKNIQNNITTDLDRVSEICDTTDNIENAQTRKELRAFYNAHLDEVLKNDEDAAVTAVVTRWKELLKLVE